jgi:CheY-like chemotaxis protein
VDRAQLVQVLHRFKSPEGEVQVLIVEDDEVCREGFERMVAREGWTARSARNGLEALEALDREVPRVILLDLMLPGMDGFRLLAELQAHDPWRGIPVVVITAKELTQDDLLRLQAPQVQRVLRKGAASKAEIVDSVRSLALRYLAEEKGEG